MHSRDHQRAQMNLDRAAHRVHRPGCCVTLWATPRAIEFGAGGGAHLVRAVHGRGQVDGVLSLGGSAGTTVGTAAMRALPFGVPKLMVSTLASGQVRQWVGVRDICMMYSVVDISGINRISRTVLTNAAHAMIGMVKARAQAH